jgi:hypothetical protein
MLGQYLKLGHVCFVPHPYQLIIHQLSYHPDKNLTTGFKIGGNGTCELN